MVSSNRMTDFQRVIYNIENYKYTKEEQVWVDKCFGPPLTAKQIYGMICRCHLHLKPEEMGEGFEVIKLDKQNKQTPTKRGLPKSFKPLLEPLTNDNVDNVDKADLKKRWTLFSKLLWWTKYVKHKEVDDDIWDLGEKLIALYPNGRKAVLIDIKESIKHRTIIEN